MKKILSLVLAALMIFTALPLTFVSAVAAEESTAAAAKPGTAPTTLPNGKTYQGVTLMKDSFDLIAWWQEKQGASWVADAQVANEATTMLRADADGIMFKIDPTAATVASDITSISIVLQIRFDGKSTYLAATPKQASTFSEATLAGGETSTWYYSKDGASWTAFHKSADRYVNVPTGKDVTYVYIPMDQFWTKSGETYIKTGTNVKTEPIVNWTDFVEMIGDDYTIGMANFFFGGSISKKENLSHDPATKISDWKIVDHVQAVEDMATSPLFKRDTEDIANITRPTGNSGAWYLETVNGAITEAAGFTVAFDTTGAAAGSDALSLTFTICTTWDGAPSSNYLCATSGRATEYGNAKRSADATSIWYWSKDGENWTPVVSDGRYMSITAERTKGYIYIPFSSWYSRYSKEAITANEGKTDGSQYIVGKKTYFESLADGWDFNYFQALFAPVAEGAPANLANDAVKFSNWALVYSDDTVASDAAPYKLPNGSYYYTENVFGRGQSIVANTNTNNGTWIGDKFASTAENGLNNGVGVMLKADASAIASGTDMLQFAFEFNAAGNNSKGTFYIASNIGQAVIHSNSVKPEGATSIWYTSVDGVTWTAASSVARYNESGASYRGEMYIYIPFSSMYTRYGTTYLTGGDAVSTEESLPFDVARELTGGIKSVTNFCPRFNSSAINAAGISDWRFVFESDVAPVAPTTHELPVVGETLMTPFISQLARPSWSGPSYFLPTAKSNFLNSDGMIFEMDTTALTTMDAPKLSIMLSMKTPLGGNGGNNYFLATAGRAADFGNAAVPANTTSTWYYSEDGANWKPYTADEDTDFMTLPAKHTKAYVYIPFDAFWSRYDADYISGKTTAADKTKPSVQLKDFLAAMDGDNFEFAYIHGYYGTGPASTGVQFSNWSFVQLDRKMSEGDKVPATLPDTQKEYSTFPFLSEAYRKYTFAESGLWLGNILTPGAVNVMQEADGVMMKVDASGITAGTSVASFAFSISATGNNGVTTYICSNLGQARGYGNTNAPEVGDSVWYISNDGENWGTATNVNGVKLAKTSAERGVFYVYIPFSEMYVRHGATYLGGGADVKETTLTYAEATEILGGWKSLNNFAIWIEESTIGKGLTISDINLVDSTPSGVFSTASVTATDTLAYNVYANVPAGATNVKMTFTLAGKTVEVVGVPQANGQVKYTFKGVLPQQMAETITATWTATVDGKTVTDTATGTIRDYALTLLDRSKYAEWHDILKSMLAYGAATQTVAGATGDLADKDVVPSLIHIDRTKVDATYVNGNSKIWTSAALVLDNAITLKVGVSAPAGVNKVIYTVGNKTVVTPILNGYVYIPVAVSEMMSDIVVKCYNGTAATADAALTIAPMYYLSKATSGDTAVSALLDATAHYAMMVSLKLGTRESVKPAHATLAQLELSNDGGMSYAIQMTDGRFIIVDGGVSEDMNVEIFWEYLLEMNGYARPQIAAWMLTHQDGDHTNLAIRVLETYTGFIDLEALAYQWPVEADYAILESDTDYIKGYKESTIEQIKSKTRRFDDLKKYYYPDVDIIDLATGSSFMIGEVKIDVLMDTQDKYPTNPMEANDLSSVWKMTFTQNTESTADDKSFMVLGDSSADRTKALGDLYDASVLKSDVLQAAHHGLYGGNKATYQEIAPSISLVPTHEERFNEFQWQYADYNMWLYTNSDEYHASQTTIVDMYNLNVTIWGK